MAPRQSAPPPRWTPPASLIRYGRTARHSAALARDTVAALGASTRTVRASLPPTLVAAAPDRAAGACFDGRRFRNSEAGSQLTSRVALTILKALASRGTIGYPSGPIPVERPDVPSAAADLAATWLGHATVLLEIDGRRLLADPMFGDRASPSPLVGPRRMHPVPLDVADLPPLDAVLISHDHYDHLDRPTIAALRTTSQAPFLVPLGVGAHLRAWGVPAGRIVELDWHHSHELHRLAITCTPARHFSGRGAARNTTLWSSWTVTGPRHRVFFGGDTGYTAAFADIGRRYGPFDLVALPIGAYDPAWPDIHMTPEQALRAHRDLAGALLLPIHWATFNLALHGWSEPVERLLRTADGQAVLTPPPGRRVVGGDPAMPEPWWRAPAASTRP